MNTHASVGSTLNGIVATDLLFIIGEQGCRILIICEIHLFVNGVKVRVLYRFIDGITA